MIVSSYFEYSLRFVDLLRSSISQVLYVAYLVHPKRRQSHPVFYNITQMIDVHGRYVFIFPTHAGSCTCSAMSGPSKEKNKDCHRLRATPLVYMAS